MYLIHTPLISGVLYLVVRNGWIVTIGSFVLTALVWACVIAQRSSV